MAGIEILTDKEPALSQRRKPLKGMFKFRPGTPRKINKRPIDFNTFKAVGPAASSLLYRIFLLEKVLLPITSILQDLLNRNISFTGTENTAKLPRMFIDLSRSTELRHYFEMIKVREILMKTNHAVASSSLKTIRLGNRFC